MALVDIGQKTKTVFQFVSSGKTTPSFSVEDCATTQYNCDYENVVMANDSGLDLENDKSSVLGMFADWTTAAVFVLQKLESGVYVDKNTIVDNTFGEWFPQGSFDSKPKYAGFIAHWALILPVYGVGEYRIKTTQTNPLNPTGQDKFSHPYCLSVFGCGGFDNTVRLEWHQNGKIGSMEKDEDILDFADINWFNQYRIPNSIFGYPKSSYETEEIQYTNGEFEEVTDIQTQTYTLTIGLLPSYLHDIIKTYALMSGTLVVSDYSTNNPTQITNKKVKKSSGYEPRWTKQNKCAPVTIELEPRINNLEKDDC